MQINCHDGPGSQKYYGVTTNDILLPLCNFIKRLHPSRMITNYFKSVALSVPPVGHATKLGRVFMANLPPRLRADVPVNFKLLEPSSNSSPELKVTYKDGTTIGADISTMATAEMFETFDRHSRKLQIQDTIRE